MRSTLFSIGAIFCMVAMFGLFLNAVCEARSSSKAIVIRKKIGMPCALFDGRLRVAGFI